MMSPNVILRYDHQALVVMDTAREWVFSADPQGRIGLIHTPEGSWKRSRWNRWYRVLREPWPALEEIGIETISAKVSVWKGTWVSARRTAVEAGIVPAANLFSQWIERFAEFHEEDALLFGRIYDAIPILPPDAYQSIYVRIQEGCPWNRCAFCDFYRSRGYRILSSNELEEHLLRLREYWKGALRSRHGLFLGDANAVAGPLGPLEERLRRILAVFPEPELSSLHSFLDFFAGPRHGFSEFQILQRLGLKRITLGIESGDREIMRQVEKPMNPSDVFHLVSSIHSAGIALNLIFLVGLGGRLRREAHFRHSMSLIKQLNAGPGDRIFLSPLVIRPKTPYELISRQRGWEELSETEMKEELLRWQQAVRSMRRIQVSPYLIRSFLY